jgi:hypothetical protein
LVAGSLVRLTGDREDASRTIAAIP